MPARLTEAARFQFWLDLKAALAGRKPAGHKIVTKAQVKYLHLTRVAEYSLMKGLTRDA